MKGWRRDYKSGWREKKEQACRGWTEFYFGEVFVTYLLGKRSYVWAVMLFTVSFCLNLFKCIRRGCGYKAKDERDVGREIPAVVLTRFR